MDGKGGNGGKTHPPEFKAKPAAGAPKERRTARETAAGRGLSPGPPFKRRKGFPGHPERASDMERRGEGGGGRRRGDGAPVRDPEVGMAASAGMRDAPRAARRRRAPHRHIRQQATSPVAGLQGAGELRRGLRGLGKRGVPVGQDEARDGHRGRLDRRQARPGRRACAPRASAPGAGAGGAKVVYLPPYSPGLSPIEKMRSKVKALPRALSKATPSDCEGVVQVVRLLGGGD